MKESSSHDWPSEFPQVPSIHIQGMEDTYYWAQCRKCGLGTRIRWDGTQAIVKSPSNLPACDEWVIHRIFDRVNSHELVRIHDSVYREVYGVEYVYECSRCGVHALVAGFAGDQPGYMYAAVWSDGYLKFRTILDCDEEIARLTLIE